MAAVGYVSEVIVKGESTFCKCVVTREHPAGDFTKQERDFIDTNPRDGETLKTP